MFLGGPPAGPPVDEDPVGAWSALHEQLTALVHAPDFEDRMLGERRLADALGGFGTGDVFLHTWDLARAAGLPDDLDPDIVHEMYEGMLPRDEMMRGEHFGPKFPVADDRSEQDKLIAFTGRDPDACR
jgi:hypothetical protein